MTMTCPRCEKQVQYALEVAMCVDRVHCLWADLDHRHLDILRDAFELMEAA